MAVKGLNFGAEVAAWVTETKERAEAVFKQSAQEVITEMQKVGPSVANPSGGEGGRMPVDTGFLRSSLQVGVNTEPVPASRPNPNPTGKFAYVASLAIAGAHLGDTITASYSAAYAPMMEYGSGKGPAYGFVRSAAAQWQAIVDRVVVRLANQSLKTTVDEAMANRAR